jgi:hypothetical protein
MTVGAVLVLVRVGGSARLVRVSGGFRVIAGLIVAVCRAMVVAVIVVDVTVRVRMDDPVDVFVEVAVRRRVIVGAIVHPMVFGAGFGPSAV